MNKFKKIQKIVITLLLAIVTFVGSVSLVYSQEDLSDAMQLFRAEQQKLKDLRKSGASKELVDAQKKVVKKLRTKVYELQSEMGM